MSKRKFDSRELRQLAEELLEEIAEGEPIPEADRADLATSLVRQWITYDGKATLFIGEGQFCFVLAETPLGTYRVIPEQLPPGWISRFIQDWKINREDLPQLFGQLNLGQSVETINRDGIPIRLWVNPKQRGMGVEQLVQQPIPTGQKETTARSRAISWSKVSGPNWTQGRWRNLAVRSSSNGSSTRATLACSTNRSSDCLGP